MVVAVKQHHQGIDRTQSPRFAQPQTMLCKAKHTP